MLYFVILGAVCALAWLLIALALIIADARNRAAWQRLLSENEVRHGR